MEITMTQLPTHRILSRRRALLTGGTALSAAALALLAGRPTLAAKNSKGHDAGKDAATLNTALALEHEGINAYTLAAQSNLLEKPVLTIAVKFQDDHKVHRDRLIASLQTLGAKPVAEKTLAEYGKTLGVEKLKSQADVLSFAAGLELEAVNAYLGIVPSFSERQLATLAGQLAADETVHFTVLNQALGRPLPAAMSFGA
jgi:rubrerythrin